MAVVCVDIGDKANDKWQALLDQTIAKRFAVIDDKAAADKRLAQHAINRIGKLLEPIFALIPIAPSETHMYDGDYHSWTDNIVVSFTWERNLCLMYSSKSAINKTPEIITLRWRDDGVTRTRQWQGGCLSKEIAAAVNAVLFP